VAIGWRDWECMTEFVSSGWAILVVPVGGELLPATRWHMYLNRRADALACLKMHMDSSRQSSVIKHKMADDAGRARSTYYQVTMRARSGAVRSLAAEGVNKVVHMSHGCVATCPEGQSQMCC
jgi:hypothetical protein